MIVKLLTEHHLEFLSLKGGCRGSSESTYVKMPHCWKSHALNRHSTIINLVKEKQGVLIPTGLKRWPLNLINHFIDITFVSPSPAGPAGCCRTRAFVALVSKNGHR